VTITAGQRLDHVRACSDFAAGLLDRYPQWADGVERADPADPGLLTE